MPFQSNNINLTDDYWIPFPSFNHANHILKKFNITDSDHIASIIGCLVALYDTPNKYYHTTNHVVKILDFANHHGIKLSPEEELAILFHDAIYIIGSKENEVKSAEFMITLMNSFGVELNRDGLAYNCIIQTQNFLNNVEDERVHLVLDLDLSSFSLDYNEFLTDNLSIEKEFNVDKSARVKFLKLFLEKPRIYYKLTQFEEKARTNIKNYILQLEDSQ